jgi:hypothetical protein
MEVDSKLNFAKYSFAILKRTYSISDVKYSSVVVDLREGESVGETT